jgi:hydrogenase assembly chaperone HypC/HupF
MCLSVPARVIAIDGAHATVDMDGRARRASMVLSPAIAVGDWALVAAGTVLRRLSPVEANELAELLRDTNRRTSRSPGDAR